MEIISTKDQIEKINSKNKLIFKKSFYGPYYVYDISYFNNYQKQMYFLKNIKKSDIDYNETLLCNSPRKLYFDIDYVFNTLDELNKNKELFIKNFQEDLKKYIKHIDTNINIDDIRILFMDASGFTNEKNKYKLSLHVIVNNYGHFTDFNKLSIIVNKFNVFTNKKYENYIDFSIYNEFRLFRTVLSISPKDGKRRSLRLYKTNNIDFFDLFVNDYKMKFKNLNYLIDIPQFDIPQNKFEIKSNSSKDIYKNYINLNILSKIMKKYDDVYYIYKFNNKKSIVNINRKKPAICDICESIHDNENAYLVFTDKNVLLGCYRNKCNKTKIVYENNNVPQNDDEDIPQDIISNLKEKNTANNLLSTINNLREKIKVLLQQYKNITNNKILPKNEIPQKVDFKKDNKNVKKIKKTKPDTRTVSSVNKYYELGKKIANKEENLDVLVKKYSNEKYIYKVKFKAMRIVKYIDALKTINTNYVNNINISIRKLFDMKKIEFENYIKNIPQNIKLFPD